MSFDVLYFAVEHWSLIVFMCSLVAFGYYMHSRKHPIRSAISFCGLIGSAAYAGVVTV